MGQLTIEGLKTNRPSRPPHIVAAALFLAAIGLNRVSTLAAVLVAILAAAMLAWRLTGLGAPILVASLSVDLDARVMRLSDPDVVVPFDEIVEPVIVRHGEGTTVWRVRLQQATDGSRSQAYELVAERPPAAAIRASGLRVESVEAPPPVI